jgi:hypothetical protein
MGFKGGCNADKKESQRQSHGQAQENAHHEGGHAQKVYDGQKNQDNLKKGSKEGAAPASITQEARPTARTAFQPRSLR